MDGNKLIRNTSLSVSERGLLVTMLSLPDGWKFSIRGLAKILPDGITKIANILNKLESLNYLRRERIYKNGRIANWDYIISDEPMEAVDPVDPDPSNNCNPSETSSFFKQPDQYVEDLDTENMNQAKQHIDIQNDNKITNYNKERMDKESIDKSLYQSISAPEEKSEINAETSKKTDGQIDRLTDKAQKAKKFSRDMKENIELIKYLIDYESYLYGLHSDPYMPKEELDEHIESIARVISGDKATVTICGQEFPHEVVKGVLLKVNMECMERAVESMRMTDIIRNHEKYFLSTLYNEINNNHFKTNHEERWSDYVIRRDFGNKV
ncbi:MAG: helix-turn-helix domain-containing protein [Ruminococcus sp.]|nr:helix-turn-helix domain-containing protein [Ruminococcus sp.]